MSGICGIIDLQGSTPDLQHLQSMTEALRSRAPDALNTWLDQGIGLGHALLKIAPEAEHDLQPASLDDHYWIVADAHLYNRNELIGNLTVAGASVSHQSPDAQLILHAYKIWGDELVTRLSGDFAFVIWDTLSKRLVCFTDPLGVRPFFYTQNNSSFAFASTLTSLRQSGRVNGTLNEICLIDFLLFGSPLDDSTTIFEGIQRLPPASKLSIQSSEISVSRYWQPDRCKAIRFKRDSEYVEQFTELLQQAVRSRSRIAQPKIALELSGGLDSGAIAATLTALSPNLAITGHCVSCQGLFDDPEADFARIQADHLGVRLQVQNCNDYALFAGCGNNASFTDEPFANPDLAMLRDRNQAIVESGARVLLSGQVADSLFSGNMTVADNLSKGNYLAFLTELIRHVGTLGTMRNSGVKSLFRRGVKSDTPPYPYPQWLQPDLANSAAIQNRWAKFWHLYNQGDAASQIARPWGNRFLQGYEYLDMPLVARHPFADIRLIEFMLGLPNYMLLDKRVLRLAMTNLMPAAILNRPKTSLLGDHIGRRMVPKQIAAILQSTPNLERWVERDKLIAEANHILDRNTDDATWDSWFIVHAASVATWLGTVESDAAT